MRYAHHTYYLLATLIIATAFMVVGCSSSETPQSFAELACDRRIECDEVESEEFDQCVDEIQNIIEDSFEDVEDRDRDACLDALVDELECVRGVECSFSAEREQCEDEINKTDEACEDF